MGLAYFSHSLKLETRALLGVEARARAARRASAAATAPGSTPLAITAGMPAAVAISAATTFERIPPEPSGEVEKPMS